MQRFLIVIALVAAAGLAVGLVAAGSKTTDRERTSTAPQHRSQSGTHAVWAVGDGAESKQDGLPVARMIATAKPKRLLYLGDVYETGTAAEYANNYAPSYGKLKSITKPTPGNHEWGNRATGYDPYWGTKYSDPHYFSFNTGGWHFISLNSEEPAGPGSAQLAWLQQDLAAHPGTCTVAYWHRPRYTAGLHGDYAPVDALWQALAGHTSVVLSGHNHDYERLKPIDGITQFVVGTGGREVYPINITDRRLAAFSMTTFGALRLRLHKRKLDYAYITSKKKRLDAGTIRCRRG